MSLRDHVFMSAVRRIPRQRLTALAGRVARQRVPAPLRRPFYGAFAVAVGANLEESAQPIESFESFNAFFTRGLRQDVRVWSGSAHDWTVPADGTLSVEGRVERGQLLQVKGIDYSVADLLDDDAATWEGARYATIYLSPADYHRVHWPVSGHVDAVQGKGGDLWPVNRASVQHVPGLFIENERTITMMTDSRGRRAAIVMVGATIVGGIELRVPFATEKHPTAIHAGDEHGRFYLGSTVVLLVQDADAPLEDTSLPLNEAVQLGQSLWRDTASS